MFNIEAIKPQIRALADKYGLSLVVLFGSQATSRTHKESDVDIAVLGTGKLDRLALGNDLEKVFSREDVELVDLDSASPTMMYVVVRDGKALYENESGSFLRWKLHAIWVWLDTAWLRKLSNKKLTEWAQAA